MERDGGTVAITAQGDLRITPEPEPDRDVPIDGRWQDETLVVVGVLADDVDAARCDRHGPRRIAGRVPEQPEVDHVEL